MKTQLLPQDEYGCPYLQLAPMEGVGDFAFRKAMAFIGGFDEAVRDFIRVPSNAHVSSLAKVYHPQELKKIPLAAQIMGSDIELMAAMARELVALGALRIDVNCGCPSNTVTGKGAGSSLLKSPKLLHEVVHSVVKAVDIPVTMKMRSGYEDTSLFKENLFAAQETGVAYITIHPRTKVDGYGPPAKWELIALAKSLLKTPIVGNGDIVSVEHALAMLRETKCDGLMIGRGAIMNPFLFLQIKNHFSKSVYQPTTQDLYRYMEVYLESMDAETPEKLRVNKLKQLLGFIFKKEELLSHRSSILTSQFTLARDLLRYAQKLIA